MAVKASSSTELLDLDKHKASSELVESRAESGVMEDSMDTSPSRVTTKRKSRCKDEKICHICGDKALGYNFNAMTCESCKAFFRRNAWKDKAMKCVFQDNCKIDVRTRRFCPKCRLTKCFEVGMVRDMILDDTERKARMQKVMANRQKKGKGQSDNVDMKVTVKEEVLSDSDMVPDQSGCSYTELGDSLLSGLMDSGQMSESFLETLNVPSPGSPGDKRDPSLYRVLSPEERTLYEGFSTVYTNTLGEIWQQGYEHSEKNYNNCTDLVNQSEIAVRRLVQFVKRLDDFNQIAVEDQIVTLKSCALSSILLRSAFFYDVERDSWVTSTGEISASVLHTSTGYSEIYHLHTTFCQLVKRLFGNDSVLFALTQLISIFDVEAAGLKNRAALADIQDKYIVLLKHYLEAEYSYAKATRLFATILGILTKMRIVSKAHTDIVLRANVADIEPLMLEVLDLKSKVSR